MKTAREIITEVYWNAHSTGVHKLMPDDEKRISSALHDLSEIVMGLKKEGEDECYGDKGRVYYSESDKAYNQAITDIAKLFRDKESGSIISLKEK